MKHPSRCISLTFFQDGFLSASGTNISPFLGFALGRLDQPGKLRFRLRGPAGEGKLVWMPGVNAAANEVKSTPFKLDGDDWQVVTADLPAPLGKPGLIRLYLPVQDRTIAIDWIELVSDASVRRWDFGGKTAREAALP